MNLSVNLRFLNKSRVSGVHTWPDHFEDNFDHISSNSNISKMFEKGLCVLNFCPVLEDFIRGCRTVNFCPVLEDFIRGCWTLLIFVLFLETSFETVVLCQFSSCPLRPDKTGKTTKFIHIFLKILYYC